jgi:probable F420-dependent oxidoreductase
LKYGFRVPTQLTDPQSIATLVQRAEDMDFHFAGVSDHLVVPRNIGSRYPYSESGDSWPGSLSGVSLDRPASYLDPLTLLSFLAARTSEIRLLTSVLVLPYRSPVLTAKVLASIDVLSHGRLIVGCGLGWMREEFQALGSPPFEERGDVTDEYIRAFKELWTSRDPEFEGRYCQFSDVTFEPKPVQKPHPPIWTGGEGRAALRRAARLADGWHPINSNPRHPLRTLQDLSASINEMRGYAEEEGREASVIEIALSASWSEDSAFGPDRSILVGSAEMVAADIHALEEFGVGYLMVGFGADTVEATLGLMERFTSEVTPLAAG